MFISEFEKEEGLWDAMSKMSKNCHAKKNKPQKIEKSGN